MGPVNVLGIDVHADVLERWTRFYAPGMQPFPQAMIPSGVGSSRVPGEICADEWRDTFTLYGGGPYVWLSEEDFNGLPTETRRELRRDQRRRMGPKPVPAWPSDPMRQAKLIRWIEAGARSSLHGLAQDHIVAASRSLLPRANELAGRFADRSGANCFATVMAVIGLPVERDWVQLDQFQSWLDEATEPCDDPGGDDAVGRVLIWHERGVLAHAAVTIGGGWLIQKPSQSWSSPVAVHSTAEVISSWNYSQTRLSRRTIRG